MENGKWDAVWKNTSRFIVDAYYYINHCTTDYLCQKWCNPVPQDGSAPNLVVVSTDNHGQLYLKCAFNTQAYEQLNAWLGGFQSILKRMTPSNFNWFLHTMLFYHTRHVLERQNQRNNNRMMIVMMIMIVMKRLIKLTRMMLMMLMYNCSYFGCANFYKYLKCVLVGYMH
jgi:hypothetical protein